jgi:hypothetical protein
VPAREPEARLIELVINHRLSRHTRLPEPCGNKIRGFPRGAASLSQNVGSFHRDLHQKLDAVSATLATLMGQVTEFR